MGNRGRASKRVLGIKSLGGLATVVLLAILFVFSVAGAQADVRHGVAVFKVCNNDSIVGQPYVCSYEFDNVDQFHDPVTVTSVVDTIAAFAGPVSSGNILG